MRGEGKKLARAAQLLARGQLRIEHPGESREQDREVAEALAAFGLEASEPLDLDEEFALWPECFEAFELWFAVQTQWRSGGRGGVNGLDYAGVEACMNLRGIPAEKRAELFAGLQVMEFATLKEWNTSR